ncbi:MAG TPA: putative sulfate/molybdate transporter [Candidatus Nanopelagicaceae bacterium]|nr:putative sulfate/molybdate transporter [Candidatus Nanopelagicaceae bacterium]
MNIKKSTRTIKTKKEPTRRSYPTKFSLSEFAGALGDWGTLIPFIIGYISIVGLNPAGVFLCLGFTNIILGIRFNLPLPVQPQKTIGTIAISQAWNPGLVISTGFGTGIIWTILGLTKFLEKIVRKVPVVLVRGIQLGLGLILGWTAYLLLISDIFLGIISVSIIILIFRFKRIPSSIILVALGIVLLFLNQSITLSNIQFGLPYFSFHVPQWDEILIGMVIAGIAQLLLTLTNVMIATISLIKDLFPERENAITASELAVNMGIMNLISPFLGGIPLCHGSGGLAAQYAFGARTGGSMILEGIMELLLGLFFSETLFLLFNNFPKAILGAMLLYTAFLLGKISFKDFESKNLPIILITAIFCFILNITLGFLVGFLAYIILKIIERKFSDQSE